MQRELDDKAAVRKNMFCLYFRHYFIANDIRFWILNNNIYVILKFVETCQYVIDFRHYKKTGLIVPRAS